MSNRPKYMDALNIRCIAPGCSQIVKSNGVAVVSHTVLEHKYSRGEESLVCRRCGNAGYADHLTGPKGNWKIKQFVEVEND